MQGTLRKDLLYDRTEKSRSCFEPAREAFDRAKEIFSNSLRSDQQQQIFCHDNNNIEELHAIVNKAKEGYERRRQKGKARQWLSSFSSRLLYYGAVLDTLAQHHPEYVSLAWGAVKFVFIVCMRVVNNSPYYSRFIGRSEPRRAYRYTCQSNVQSCRFLASPTTCHHSVPNTGHEASSSAVVRTFDGFFHHGLAMVSGGSHEAHVTFHHSAS